MWLATLLAVILSLLIAALLWSRRRSHAATAARPWMSRGLIRHRLPLVLPIARERIVEAISDAVLVLDLHGNLAEVNREAARILGVPASRLIGRPAAIALAHHPDLVRVCDGHSDARKELAIRVENRSVLFDAKCSALHARRGRLIGSVVVLRDINDLKAAEANLRVAHDALEQRVAERTLDLRHTILELRDAQGRLSHAASHDNLTGMANRSLFAHRLSVRNRESTFQPKTYAVLYIDVDRFKVYNDGYGHHMGDLILVEIGRKLTECLSRADTVARIGGDEFTLLLHSVTATDDAYTLAERCRLELARPMWIDQQDVHLTVSIGIALSGVVPRQPNEIIREADLAMYEAKQLGGNRCVLFGEALRAKAVSRLELEQDLRGAISRGELIVHYQPFVHIPSGRIVGFEALVRWNHPVKGLLPPSGFLPVAEQTGLIIPIDEFVLREACRQRRCWEKVARAPDLAPFVSVNVSGWQFSHPERWWRTVGELDLGTNGLRLEMMESILIAHAQSRPEFFEQIRERNLQISLDDFGTGYSSLAWLSSFPIRTLKIDRSFVTGVANGGRDSSIIRAILALAHSLDMEVVAEGIEDREQSEALQELGCEYGQGFHFSEPVDAAKAMAMIA